MKYINLNYNAVHFPCHNLNLIHDYANLQGNSQGWEDPCACPKVQPFTTCCITDTMLGAEVPLILWRYPPPKKPTIEFSPPIDIITGLCVNKISRTILDHKIKFNQYRLTQFWGPSVLSFAMLPFPCGRGKYESVLCRIIVQKWLWNKRFWFNGLVVDAPVIPKYRI